MSDYPQDSAEQSSQEMNLNGAILELRAVARQLVDLVYGNPQGVAEEPKTSEPADKITKARNNIMDVTVKLKDVVTRLELLGK